MSNVQADLYPSRQHNHPSWQERLDPIAWHSDAHSAPLSSEQLSRFERDGFLVLDNVFSADEVQLFKAELARMRTISCSILLTDNHPWNGPLILIPGSHRHYISCVGATPENHYQQSLRRQEFGIPDEDSLRRLVDRYGIQQATGPAGSVVLFDCNTLHGSGSNIAPSPRSNLFFVYNPMDNQPAQPFDGMPPRPEFVAERGPVEALDIGPQVYRAPH